MSNQHSETPTASNQPHELYLPPPPPILEQTSYTISITIGLVGCNSPHQPPFQLVLFVASYSAPYWLPLANIEFKYSKNLPCGLGFS